MRTETPVITKLASYQAPQYNILHTDLSFDLSPKKTLVTSRLTVERKGKGDTAFFLNGENISLISIKIDGKPVPKSNYTLGKTGLTIKTLPDHCLLEIINSCDPSSNTTLMGLYVSGGRFCTQCEAEGFRRITYYLDRPDALSVFRVRMQANKKDYPILLANGNCVETGDLDGGAHFAVWEDPFPKPCYLFALVAGQFETISDTFTTMSGRNIPLDIFVDPGDGSRAHYAMDALKRSMRWDETAFGREYDLDRFMIVAVRDFNFGAMENKGLNIFNSSLLLADEKSATDMNFERIESVVAHEYFHNWTGNRITCRDWFQLCLKEGFTVFRDQEFSADQRGAALQRIKDVNALRARQFPEDAGPLAHPVRPASYMKIDNFYTATIYEKGAELIRMLKVMLGPDTFRAGSDHYFESLDGTAATVEEFIGCFEHISGKNLSQFMRWYEQAGTPRVKIECAYNETARTFVINFEQSTPPTPGQTNKKPLLIPIKIGLLDQAGALMASKTELLQNKTLEVRFDNINERPILSAFQEFSAPVTIDLKQSIADRILLMSKDPDLFNRWEAGQSLARDILCDLSIAVETGRAPGNADACGAFLNALDAIVSDPDLDDGYKAMAMQLPSDGAILQALFARRSKGSDPLAVRAAIKMLRRAICENSAEKLLSLYERLSSPITFAPDASGAGRRALRNTALSLLSNNGSKATHLARTQFEDATNMTEEIAALLVIVRIGGQLANDALDRFYKKWQTNPLVLDKWFAAYAQLGGQRGFEAIKTLTDHPAFATKNPNRVRSLIGGFAVGNPESFHRFDGAGYEFYTDNVLDMDKRNPQVAARLLGAFEIWPKLDSHRQEMIKSQLKRILASNPSANVLEIATKSLGA